MKRIDGVVRQASCLNSLERLLPGVWTSIHAILRLPPYAFSTAASKTRTLARQMSGPVPSPSMNGMIGRSGTCSLPLLMEIVWPSAGGVTSLKVAMKQS